MRNQLVTYREFAKQWLAESTAGINYRELAYNRLMKQSIGIRSQTMKKTNSKRMNSKQTGNKQIGFMTRKIIEWNKLKKDAIITLANAGLLG